MSARRIAADFRDHRASVVESEAALRGQTVKITIIPVNVAAAGPAPPITVTIS